MKYVYIVLGLTLVLTAISFAFFAMEESVARKQGAIRWYLLLNEKFTFKKNQPSLFIVVLVMFTSEFKFFSTQWFLEILGFLIFFKAMEYITQFGVHYFGKIIYAKKIQAAKLEKEYIEKEFELYIPQDPEPIEFSLLEYLPDYLKQEDHVAFLSVDGGKILSTIDNLPPITYCVDGMSEHAKEVLEPRNIKVTTQTKEGQLPFKDEKIDVAVSLYSNYQKFELYRILKPGGKAVLFQLSSDNYQEIMKALLPLKLKGKWDEEACLSTLQEIGFEVIDHKQSNCIYTFSNLEEVLTFVNRFLPNEFTMEDKFLNFYSYITKTIREQGVFTLTQNDFFVVVQRPIEE